MKTYNVKYGIGKAKYVVSYSDGTKRHNDGSKFFDIKVFDNKKELHNFTKELITLGFTIN